MKNAKDVELDKEYFNEEAMNGLRNANLGVENHVLLISAKESVKNGGLDVEIGGCYHRQ
jgi:hypothetical protein